MLAASAPLTFVYDDKGFSSAASFVNFSAVEDQQGSVTITAKFGNPLTTANAKLISWYGYLPTPTGGFSLDTAILGDQFTTREYPTPEINVSFSQPGVHFFGIYAAWNGQYGASSGTGIHMQAWPRDLKTGKLFRPFAVVTPFENGTIPAGLPANYDGHTIVTKPIPVGRAIPNPTAQTPLTESTHNMAQILHKVHTCALPDWVLVVLLSRVIGGWRSG